MKERYKKIVRGIKKTYIKLTNKKEITYKTRFGFKIILDLSKDVDSNFYFDDFENKTINYFSKVVKKGMTVFDIGANIGIYTLIASQNIKQNGRVYSFEPAEWSYNRLQQNINLSKYNNIIINKFGISDFTGEIKFHICEDDAYNSIGNRPMKDVISVKTIKVFSLDDYVILNKIGRIDIIKVDTEGAEYLVFKGAEKTLMKHSPTIFFEYNPYAAKGYEFSSLEALRLVESYGYHCYEFVEERLIEIKEDKIQTFDIIGFKNPILNSTKI